MRTEQAVRRTDAAVVFALEAISQYGEPIEGAGRDYVRIRLTQQELARRTACAPSTIAWYLRQLGSAVVSRRGGLVFDRTALHQLTISTSRVAPRTEAVERELLRSFAEPAADGTGVEVSASLQDLASHLGINRSSAYRHVAALQQAGRLQRRGRRLFLVDADELPKETLIDTPSSDSTSAPVGVTTDDVLRLLDKVTDVMTSVADTALALVRREGAISGAQDPRLLGAQPRGLRAGTAAERTRGFSLGDLTDLSGPEISSDPSRQHAANSRDAPSPRAEDSRIDGRRDWTAADLPTLLAPLLEECDRRGLPGVSDARRVLESLACYDAEQVAGAARQMAADLRSGAPMRSPIAILVRKADDGDPYYFRSKPAPPPPPPPPLLLEEEEPVDEEALVAVAALNPQALAELDDAVTTRVRRLLGDTMAATALASPATFAHWRPLVWRALQDRKEQV